MTNNSSIILIKIIGKIVQRKKLFRSWKSVYWYNTRFPIYKYNKILKINNWREEKLFCSTYIFIKRICFNLAWKPLIIYFETKLKWKIGSPLFYNFIT